MCHWRPTSCSCACKCGASGARCGPRTEPLSGLACRSRLTLRVWRRLWPVGTEHAGCHVYELSARRRGRYGVSLLALASQSGRLAANCAASSSNRQICSVQRQSLCNHIAQGRSVARAYGSPLIAVVRRFVTSCMAAHGALRSVRGHRYG